jgi:hypothetical protein
MIVFIGKMNKKIFILAVGIVVFLIWQATNYNMALQSTMGQSRSIGERGDVNLSLW